MARLRTDFWVSAYLRRLALEGIDAVLRRRGAAEAGTIFIKVDRIDGTASLYGPAPQAVLEEGSGERLFVPVLVEVSPAEIEERMKRELRFDSDLWLVEIDDRAGRHLLDLASEPPKDSSGLFG